MPAILLQAPHLFGRCGISALCFMLIPYSMYLLQTSFENVKTLHFFNRGGKNRADWATMHEHVKNS